MDPKLIAPVLAAVFVMWALYRRARRAIGRQQIFAGRMWTRIGTLALVGAIALASAAHQIGAVAAMLGGIACGAALGYVGLRYTRFEVTPQGRFYTPHTYIGLIVVALFVGRLLYRLLMMYSGAHGFAAGGAGFGVPDAHVNPHAYASPYSYQGPYAFQGPYGYQRSPLTLAILGALVGYYVLYYLGVLLRSRSRAGTPQQSNAQLP
ncbi:MAG: hypothetical protein ACREUG_17885 [Steroidobacteraceae bacterium]